MLTKIKEECVMVKVNTRARALRSKLRIFEGHEKRILKRS